MKITINNFLIVFNSILIALQVKVAHKLQLVSFQVLMIPGCQLFFQFAVVI